tara:strand:- start:28 stop:234 length:207 start_codon:yes stop_codon:yes gene_type:complete
VVDLVLVHQVVVVVPVVLVVMVMVHIKVLEEMVVLEHLMYMLMDLQHQLLMLEVAVVASDRRHQFLIV